MDILLSEINETQKDKYSFSMRFHIFLSGLAVEAVPSGSVCWAGSTSRSLPQVCRSSDSVIVTLD